MGDHVPPPRRRGDVRCAARQGRQGHPRHGRHRRGRRADVVGGRLGRGGRGRASGRVVFRGVGPAVRREPRPVHARERAAGDLGENAGAGHGRRGLQGQFFVRQPKQPAHVSGHPAGARHRAHDAGLPRQAVHRAGHGKAQLPARRVHRRVRPGGNLRHPQRGYAAWEIPAYGVQRVPGRRRRSVPEAVHARRRRKAARHHAETRRPQHLPDGRRRRSGAAHVLLAFRPVGAFVRREEDGHHDHVSGALPPAAQRELHRSPQARQRGHVHAGALFPGHRRLAGL